MHIYICEECYSTVHLWQTHKNESEKLYHYALFNPKKYWQNIHYCPKIWFYFQKECIQFIKSREKTTFIMLQKISLSNNAVLLKKYTMISSTILKG